MIGAWRAWPCRFLRHYGCHELLLVLLHTWMGILVDQIDLCTHHANLLQMVVELFVTVGLSDVELMRVPILREYLLDVVLVHPENH